MFKLKLLVFIIVFFPVIISAQIPAGSVARFSLATNANDATGNGYNGTVTGISNTTDRFGNANAALGFSSGTSSGALPLALVTAIQNDFSVGYWFKTSMTANSSASWFGGNSLVDAEVCGGTNDWGTALIDGGRVCFGIGNTDITIKSASSSFNDNTWHFVTATRNATAGTIILYVDGVLEASTAGTNTGALNAPAFIGLGQNPCSGTGVLNGSLDDIVFYDRVLSATDVSNLYSALSVITLPVRWFSFTGTYRWNNIALQWQTAQEANNDYFEIEDATDGVHYLAKGSMPANMSAATGGEQSYTFSIANPTGGNHYCRIKQIDKDGVHTYSPTIKITVGSSAGGFMLQTNPVVSQMVLLNQNNTMIRQLQIVDLSGRIISNQLVQTNNAVVQAGIPKLVPGYYLLRVVTASGSSVLPLVKQ